ncbi:MAG: hypothetical protein B7Z16_18535 [Algoriphagus sp. 32-45-6]|nr:MAG: hypothetical protein B7Z16_18535 [Algoriphagus sp. 32-45-6]
MKFLMLKTPHAFTMRTPKKFSNTLHVSLLFFIMAGAFAQNTIDITGRILEASSLEPLSGALIVVPSSLSQKSTTADSQGYFKIALTPGEHPLLISFLGYESKEVVVNTNNPHLGAMALPISNTTLKEIIISASPQRYSSDFKGSNFRINPLGMKNTNPLNTEELLRTVPGVNIVGDMGLSNRPNISIRGSWGRRSQKILLLEDGSPIAPAPYMAPGTYYNPVSDRLTAIEVLKGADILSRLGFGQSETASDTKTRAPP